MSDHRGELWLPKGYRNDLHIEHAPRPATGAFTGGGWKLCWHITVSAWNTVDSMVRVLKDKRAEPHLVIGGRTGAKHPIVVQLLPFDQFGKSLAHPSGPETNRANTIQVEVCATPASVAAFTEFHYKALANLSRMIQERVPVPNKLARRFSNDKRMTGAEWVRASGHIGHMHCPGNDHSDPTTAFKGSRLVGLTKRAPHDL